MTLDNLSDIPPDVRSAVYWELEVETEVEEAFEKEEWFSQVLLEWGSCGKMLVEDDRGAVAFAQYAPPSFFPRLTQFRCGRVSPDAIYLAYCYAVPERRGFGLGREVIRSVAADLLDRGFRAVESIGSRVGAEGWILPVSFLASAGFVVVRDDARFPLLRLDLSVAVEPQEAAEAVGVPLPAPGAA
ncbi:MAG TPA: GNAT family N-acetyltransferase [Actinomycetota bacterium]|nr:GNAT family N-acetyltransferase [Actinomycetota bacterium]